MTQSMAKKNIKDLAISVIQLEADAIQALASRIDDHFERACQHILQCQGRVIVIGMGKSGHIGSKIAATLASTGTPSFFIHPSEASHGDMGMITRQDVVITISDSGETPEMVTLLPFLKRMNVTLIAMTGNPQSTLAKTAAIHLNISVSHEACPLGLAPTTSTTATLVMGDALAVSLLEAREFTPNDFALFHPAGTLGKRLLLQVGELMHSGDNIPKVVLGTSLKETLYEMTTKKLGMTTVCDNHNTLKGIYTDGDLRRTIDNKHNIHSTIVDDVMTSTCQTIPKNTLAVDALSLMQENKITSLVVTDSSNTIEGILHLHDLLQAGVG